MDTPRFNKKMTGLSPKQLQFTFGNRTWRMGDKPIVMGILNVTPDSFSDGGCFDSVERAVEQALQMQHEGADVIDIGGESTRPGAARVDAEQELRRVLPIIERLSGKLDVPISIDTQKAGVARRALEAGAEIINDISGFHHDPDMWRLMKETDAGAVVMHMRGNPETMQQFTQYDNLIDDLVQYFEEILETADKHGISRERFVIDPGIGFSKTVKQNLELIARACEFRNRLNRPVLIGPSRKSFIGKILEIDAPQDRAWGTAGAVAAAVMQGADIIRVHDVAEMRQAAIVAARCKRQQAS
jgi:dihydropteroate synthase